MRNNLLKMILFFSIFLAIFSFNAYSVEYLTDINFNVTDVHYSDVIQASANWNETVNNSFISYNPALAEANVNNTIENETYNNSWTNYSISTNTSWSLGQHNVIIYVLSTFESGPVENVTTQKAFTLWGWSGVNESSNTTSAGECKENYLSCRIIDKNTTNAITDYNVTFYDNTTFLGSSLTNSSGWATINYTWRNPSVYSVTCNITDAPDMYYNDSESNTLTTDITVNDIAPQWSNSVTSLSSPVAYSSGQSYRFNTTWIDSSLANVTFNIRNVTSTSGGPVDITFDSILNSTNLTNYSVNDYTKIFSTIIYDLPVGTYNYTWTARDASSKVNSTSYNYTVNRKATTITSFTASPGWTVSTSQTVTITCSVNNPVNVEIYIGGTKAGNGTSSATATYSNTQAATTTSDCQATETANYTGGILSSNTITVTSSSSGTGTNTGTGSSSSTEIFSIKDLTSTLSMNAGESKPTTFKLSNTYTNNLQNVNISVSGIDSGWYELSKKTISSLVHGSTETITLTFNIPSSADAKSYDITITAKGSDILTKIVRTATNSTKLNVTSSAQTVATPLTDNSSASSTNETSIQNATSGEELVGPTGLSVTFEYLKNNILIIIAIAACVLIFLFRDNVNENLAKVTSGKTYKAYYKKSPINFSSLKDKLNYKMPNLRKKGKAKNLGPEKPGIRRPEVLEREIKRDIKELQHVIDTEKMMNKKKKLDAENN